jgi:hypothetical protein
MPESLLTANLDKVQSKVSQKPTEGRSDLSRRQAIEATLATLRERKNSSAESDSSHSEVAPAKVDDKDVERRIEERLDAKMLAYARQKKLDRGKRTWEKKTSG